MYSGVVVVQQVGADVINVLPVFLTEVAWTIVVAKAVAKGQPCSCSVDVSLIIDDLIHLGGDMILVFG